MKKKKEIEDKTGTKSQRPTCPPCDTCGKKNQPTERCWQGAGAHLRPNDNTNTDDSNEDGKPKKSNNNEISSPGQSTSKKQGSKHRFCHDSKYMTTCRYDNLSYQIYPPTINLRYYIKDTNGIPSVVWQQQMEKAYIKTYKVVHNDRPDRH